MEFVGDLSSRISLFLLAQMSLFLTLSQKADVSVLSMMFLRPCLAMPTVDCRISDGLDLQFPDISLVSQTLQRSKISWTHRRLLATSLLLHSNSLPVIALSLELQTMPASKTFCKQTRWIRHNVSSVASRPVIALLLLD
jgi:hypothetical protein